MSNFLNLNSRDYWKGLIVAVLAVVVGGLTELLNAGAFPTSDQWLSIAKLAVSAGFSYLLKNLLTNNQDQILTKDR